MLSLRLKIGGETFCDEEKREQPEVFNGSGAGQFIHLLKLWMLNTDMSAPLRHDVGYRSRRSLQLEHMRKAP